MGYTRYWTRTNKKITQECVDEINKILENCKKLNITICGPNGFGDPIVNTDIIAFNGPQENDLGHESFTIDDDEGFNVCKTARKPYDYAVRESLNILNRYNIVSNIRSDGENNEIIDDEGWLQA